MPSLQATLEKESFEYLRAVAQGWQLDIDLVDPRQASGWLAERLLDGDLVDEVLAALPEEAQRALGGLQGQAGREPWPRFARKYGDIRQMGAVRLSREKPHLNPISTAEILYYHALVARAFFDTPDGPQEFAFVPEDLVALLPDLPPIDPVGPGRPAADADCAHIHPASDAILDDAVTWLAGLRMGRDYDPDPEHFGLRTGKTFLEALFDASGLTDRAHHPDPESVRRFFEMPRGEALLSIVQIWLDAPRIDELRLTPGLRFEGAFENDPVRTRRLILQLVDQLPGGTWWHIGSFVAAVKDRRPDFQRKAGEYDSWYVQDADSGRFLRGFEHWDQVEGRLLRWLLTGPFHWLGLVDLAGPDREASPAAFRLSDWAIDLLEGRVPDGIPEEKDRVHILSTGMISATGLVPRTVRYQVSRFCEWEAVRAGEYRYRPSPASLQHAADAGLRIDAFISLLSRNSDAIPPNVTRALKDWESQGKAARISHRTVLQLSGPEALEALRASRAARFLGETLGPAAVTIASGSEEQVIAVLMELGFLGEVIH